MRRLSSSSFGVACRKRCVLDCCAKEKSLRAASRRSHGHGRNSSSSVVMPGCLFTAFLLLAVVLPTHRTIHTGTANAAPLPLHSPPHSMPPRISPAHRGVSRTAGHTSPLVTGLFRARASASASTRYCEPPACCQPPTCCPSGCPTSPPATTTTGGGSGSVSDDAREVGRRTAVWVIVLIPILVFLLLLLLLCLLCAFLWRRRRQRRTTPPPRSTGPPPRRQSQDSWGAAGKRRSYSYSKRSSHQHGHTHGHKHHSSISAVSKSYAGVRKKCAPPRTGCCRCPNCGRKLRIPITGHSGTWRHCDKGCTPQCGGCRHSPTGKRCCKQGTRVDVYVQR